MTTLFEDYNPEQPLATMPMNALYRLTDSSEEILQCFGIWERGDKFDFWFSKFQQDQQLDCRQMTREEMRNYRRVGIEEMGEDGRKILERQAHEYAEIGKAFAELVQYPNAGKGLEHFY